jgi:class 3 adenylate cyclase
MALMKSGQAPPKCSLEVAGSRDDGSTVKLDVSLLGFGDSFMLICRDHTDEMRVRADLDALRGESERLVRAMIPAEILNHASYRGTSFVSQSTAIAMINIGQFSDYMSSVGPADVLNTITSIYRAFEKSAVNFPGLRQIKIMGDGYVVGAGFLNPDSKTESAMTVIQFGLGCHELIEQVNIAVGAGLTLRIGGHLGGDLRFGVLDNVFEVVGPPLWVARQLESRCLEHTVNISECMYEFIAHGEFQIDPHEKIELEGLGLKQTYSISPVKRVAGSGSRYQAGFGVHASGSTHMSMFQVPSLVQLMSSGGTDMGIGASDEDYAPPTLDFLMNPG